jgi:hypothetical protein
VTSPEKDNEYLHMELDQSERIRFALTAKVEQLEKERDELARVYAEDVIPKWRAKVEQLEQALREVVNTLGPDYFGGEPEGLVAEGNEALRVARAALDREEVSSQDA